ncbi:hypothetical protein BGY98DRAFT_936832 [Russula aff. rugulosa BPL654]|nr:hypothetical protein BGY98DRAFT_936832 [Russula aff. rugulosa BPL654]
MSLNRLLFWTGPLRPTARDAFALSEGLYFEPSAFPLALHDTHVVFLLLKHFSSELETEVKVILGLLIKFIGGETEPIEPRPVWMRVLAMVIICGICSDAEFMHSVRQCYDALATDDDTGTASSTHLGQRRGDTASATMLNVVGDDWHRGRLERANCSNEGAMLCLRIDFLPIDCQPFSVAVLFLLVINQLDKASAPHPGGVHTSPWRAIPRLTLRRPRGVYHPSLPDYHTRAQFAAEGRLAPALLVALSILLTTSLFDSIFGDVLGAL